MTLISRRPMCPRILTRDSLNLDETRHDDYTVDDSPLVLSNTLPPTRLLIQPSQTPTLPRLLTLVLLPAFHNLVRCLIALGRLRLHYHPAGASTPEQTNPIASHRARDLFAFSPPHTTPTTTSSSTSPPSNSLRAPSTPFRASPLDSASSADAFYRRHTTAPTRPPLRYPRPQALACLDREHRGAGGALDTDTERTDCFPRVVCLHFFRYCDDDAASFDDGHHLQESAVHAGQGDIYLGLHVDRLRFGVPLVVIHHRSRRGTSSYTLHARAQRHPHLRAVLLLAVPARREEGGGAERQAGVSMRSAVALAAAKKIARRRLDLKSVETPGGTRARAKTTTG
ncbi:hypothetical protein C8R45DRAFT_1171971 [Mycena sanguinolenta]|nr:hypothetical protein C8R45DRAFT_1171971 [Mycena sanguinolenta]